MRILGPLFALWAATPLVTAQAASANEKTVVVELFTSQGCSSCPPADALLAELDKSADVIALALHVDYWDYIGWKDSFADPGNTERQRGYAHAAAATSIYTPQMVIGGLDHVIGYKPMDVANTVQKHRAAPDGADVTARFNGDSVVIRLAPNLNIVCISRWRSRSDRSTTRPTKSEVATATNTVLISKTCLIFAKSQGIVLSYRVRPKIQRFISIYAISF